MEAIAAFGLACNVMQVIDFSFTLAKECREILENGSLQDHDQLNDVVSAIKRISENVSNQLASNEHRLTPEEEAPRDIASKTTRCAKKLIAVLEKFNLKGREPGFSNALRLITATSKRKNIEKLRKEL